MAATLPAKPRSFWIALGVLGLLVCIWLGLLAVLFLSGSDETLRALSSGQRLVVDLKTGQISGEMRKAKSAEGKPEAEEKKPQTVLPSQPETDPSKPEPVATEVVPANPETQAHPKFDVAEPSAPSDEEEPAEPLIVQPSTVTLIPEGPESLAAAPAPGLSEAGDQGAIPTISPDGIKPAKHYARPFTAQEGKPYIALLITNLGLSHSATQAALELPPAISLGFTPYAAETPNWVKNARNLGHETWLHLPIEPGDYPASDAGPKALRGDLPPEELVRRLHWSLSRFAGLVGLYTTGDSKFYANEEAMQVLGGELSKRGLMLIKNVDSGSAGGIPVPIKDLVIPVDYLIDGSLSTSAIDGQLKKLEEIAKTRGFALGVARGYPITLGRIKSWSATLDSKNIMLAPASALMR